jgi:hypothetical protein
VWISETNRLRSLLPGDVQDTLFYERHPCRIHSTQLEQPERFRDLVETFVAAHDN